MNEAGGGADNLQSKKETIEGWAQRTKRETDLRNRWQFAGEADPKVLDAWLDAKIDLYQYRLQKNMIDPYIGSEREEIGERLLFHQRIARGSYQREKALFCDDLAQSFKQEAENAETRIAEGIGDENDLNLNRELVTSNRKIAANILRMEANCLTFQDEKARE